MKRNCIGISDNITCLECILIQCSLNYSSKLVMSELTNSGKYFALIHGLSSYGQTAVTLVFVYGVGAI